MCAVKNAILKHPVTIREMLQFFRANFDRIDESILYTTLVDSGFHCTMKDFHTFVCVCLK